MNLTSSRIYLALLFAAAIIASSYAFKGSALSSVVVTALTGIGLVFVVLTKPSCVR